MIQSAATLSLFPAHDGTLGRLVRAIESAVRKSFDSEKMRNLTQAEVKRRSEIALKIAKQLRGDHHWGMERIDAFLPTYLRDELTGVSWEPDKRAVWMPGDGR